ncbi:MAG: WGR domain-containing protein [Vulcanimicrobiota bacterium]
MRRFEDGQAGKFYEVELVANELHSRAGQLGKAGRRTVKVHEDEARAMAALEKKVAEKLKQGFREVAPGLPDESGVRLPDGWLKLVLPRQGGRWRPRLLTLPIDEALALGRQKLEQSPPHAAPRWKAALAAFSRGDEATLEEAAAMGWALAHARDASKARRALVDFWMQKYDPALATAAIMETDLLMERHAERPDPSWDVDYFYRLRKHLGLAEPEGYRLALQVAAERRKAISVTSRVRTAFLFPTEKRWLLQDLDRVSPTDFRWLVGCVGDPETATRVLARGGLGCLVSSAHNLVPTLLDGLGAGAAAVLAEFVDDRRLESDAVGPLARALAAIPRPEALDSLLRMVRHHKRARPALEEALERFPRLGLEILSRHQVEQGLAQATLERHPQALEAIRDHLSQPQLAFLSKVAR